MLDTCHIGLTPTTQRTFGYPSGECVQASYAALLDLPLSSVPRFDPEALNGDDRREREQEWLASIGFYLIEISTSPNEELPKAVLDCVPPMEHLISGLSPRGYGHRCVGFGGKVLWDPHPSRAGLVKVYSVGFLVPL